MHNFLGVYVCGQTKIDGQMDMITITSPPPPPPTPLGEGYNSMITSETPIISLIILH